MSNKLELLVRKAARELRDQQVCVLYKIPEEMQQTPCDFIGYTASGRCILIECKMVKRPSLPIGKAPGLAAHQWRALLEATGAGCLAIIIWMRGDELNFLKARPTTKKSFKWVPGFLDQDDLVSHIKLIIDRDPVPARFPGTSIGRT